MAKVKEKVDCSRCGDRAGIMWHETASPWWARNPDGEKVPVCAYCFSQLQNHAAWDDEPAHKKMEREGV